MTITLEERFLGAMLALACGDALGTSVEFSARGSFVPLTDIRGGGPFSLKPGYWTDDTSMALCLAESLLQKQGFDAQDQMGRYLNWWKWGYLSSTGDCFDIGMTVRCALQSFQETGDPFSGSVDPDAAGNGSLMRLVPVVLFYFGDSGRVQEYAIQSSRTTHGTAEVLDCCRLFARLLEFALQGGNVREAFPLKGLPLHTPKVMALANGEWRAKRLDEIRGSGYCVESLEAALWCFNQTTTLRDALLAAANLGDDADTTAAIVGQLAGAYYGVQAIPKHWLGCLHMGEEIAAIARSLHTVAKGRQMQP